MLSVLNRRRPALSLRCHGSELRRRVPAVPWSHEALRCARSAVNRSSLPRYGRYAGRTSPWWPVAPSLPSPLGCPGQEDSSGRDTSTLMRMNALVRDATVNRTATSAPESAVGTHTYTYRLQYPACRLAGLGARVAKVRSVVLDCSHKQWRLSCDRRLEREWREVERHGKPAFSNFIQRARQDTSCPMTTVITLTSQATGRRSPWMAKAEHAHSPSRW